MCVIENRVYVFNNGKSESYEHKRLCDRAVGNMPCRYTTKEERILTAGRPPHSPRLSYGHDPLPSPASSGGFPPTPPDGMALAGSTRPRSRHGSSSSPLGRKQSLKGKSTRYYKPELVISIGNDRKGKKADRDYHHGHTPRSSMDDVAVLDPPSPVSSTVAQTGTRQSLEGRRPFDYVTMPTPSRPYLTTPVSPTPTFSTRPAPATSRRARHGENTETLAPPPAPPKGPRPPAPSAAADPPSPCGPGRRRKGAPAPIITGPHQAQRESEEARQARIERERPDHRQQMRDQHRADQFEAEYWTKRATAREEAREAKRRSQGSPGLPQEYLEQGRDRVERLKRAEAQSAPKPRRPSPPPASGSNWEESFQQGRKRLERQRKYAEHEQIPSQAPRGRGHGLDRSQSQRVPTSNAGPCRTHSMRTPADRGLDYDASQRSGNTREQDRLLAAELEQLSVERRTADLVEQEEKDARDRRRRQELGMMERQAEVDTLEQQLRHGRRQTDYNPRSGMRPLSDGGSFGAPRRGLSMREKGELVVDSARGFRSGRYL